MQRYTGLGPHHHYGARQRDSIASRLVGLVLLAVPLVVLAWLFKVDPKTLLEVDLPAELTHSERALPRAAREPALGQPAGPAAAAAAPATTLPAADWEIPNGRFFTQTNGRPERTSATGYAVSNAEGVPFWDAFNQLGGVNVLGYPISHRFTWRGLTTQVFQRAALQWNPAERRVQLVLLMDELSDAGKDEWLEQRYQVPRRLDPSRDAGKSWEEIVRDRLTLLQTNADLEAFYQSARDPLALYGLPTSRVVDVGSHYAIRTQRTVLQQWKQQTAWAAAGQVTLANAGSIARDAGLFPSEPFTPLEVGEAEARANAAPASTAAPAVPGAPPAGQRFVVANTDGLGVYLRRTPNPADRVRAWPERTVMVAVGPDREVNGVVWKPVRAPDGAEGWVPAQYLAPAPEASGST